MKKVILFTLSILISIHMNAQATMKKIELQKGVNEISYKDLNLIALLQVYDENAASHLVGDVYLGIDIGNENIASFYVEKDTSKKDYSTKIYKNYLLTFMIEKDKKYLVIESAQTEKAFALSSNGTAIIAADDVTINIEITDHIVEYGYDGQPDDENRTAWSNVDYTLNVKINEVDKNFNFFSSQIEDDFTIEMEGYSIEILSDQTHNSYALIEMIIHKKGDK